MSELVVDAARTRGVGVAMTVVTSASSSSSSVVKDTHGAVSAIANSDGTSMSRLTVGQHGS